MKTEAESIPIENLSDRVTFEAYRDLAAISQSDLKACYDNPQLYYEVRVAKTRPPRPPSDSQEWGRKCEARIQGKEVLELPSNLIVIPQDVLNKQGHRKGKAYDAWKKEQPDDAELWTEAEVAAEHRKVRCFDEAVANIAGHGPANAMLNSPTRLWSQRYRWWDPEYGLEFKCEMDIIDPTLRSIVDVKTANDVKLRSFESDLLNWGYDIQAAHYLRAARLAYPEIDDWVYAWIVIANQPPYNCEVFQATDPLLELGESRLRYRIEFYKECLDTGRWKTPTHGIVNEVYPPKWAKELV